MPLAGLLLILATAAQAAPLSQPLLDRLVREQKAATFVHRTGADPQGKVYFIQGLVLTPVEPERVRAKVLNYGLYPRISRHVTRASWNAKAGRLTLAGSLWRFRVELEIAVEPVGPYSWSYRVTSGDAKDANGQLSLERWPDSGTLISFTGSVRINRWIPEAVVRKGVEVVVGDALSKLRELMN